MPAASAPGARAATASPSRASASRSGPSGRSARLAATRATAAGLATARAGAAGAGAATSCTKRSRSTRMRPAWLLTRCITDPAACCNSIATGPAQASVRVPPDSRRGVVMAAIRGPTMAGHSGSNCATPGARPFSAGRMIAGSSAATDVGAHTRRGSGAAGMVAAGALAAGALAAGTAVLSVALRLAIHPLVSSSPIPRSEAAALLRWYDRHRRILPWRARPGESIDPYRVWLSEIMLQQTSVAVARSYYERWLQRFPDLRALADAAENDVLSAWAGLGYYARARNLIACARQVVGLGGFPRTVAGLQTLPGIGPYTAAAIAAIAFGVPVVPIDGNVERVMARLRAIALPLPAAKPAIRAAAEALGADPAARARPSDFAQALFDLGATICTPTSPACALCPLREGCAARRANVQTTLPLKTKKPDRPHRHGVHFWLTDATGQVLLRRRPPTGLLGGMTELPGTGWTAAPPDDAAIAAAAPMPATWRPVGQVRHVFTHFSLTLLVLAARVERIDADGFLRPADALAAEALPSVMRKCAALGVGAMT